MKRMKKMKTAHYALLFMACMAACLFTSITARANGLVAAEWLDYDEDGTVCMDTNNTPAVRQWDNDGNVTGVEPIEKSSWHFASLPGESLWIGYDDGTNVTPVSLDQLTLTYYGDTVPGEEGAQKSTSNATLSVDEKNSNLIYFNPNGETGYYKISYTKDPENFLSIQADYPEIGFYSQPVKSVDNLIDTVRIYKGATTEFYVYLNKLGESITLDYESENNDGTTIYPFVVSDWLQEEPTVPGTSAGVSGYFSAEKVTDSEGWYKITINTNTDTSANNSFEISVNAWKTDKNEDTSTTGYSLTETIPVKFAPNGLFAIPEGEDEAQTEINNDIAPSVSTFSLQFASVTDNKATVTNITDLSKITIYEAEWDESKEDYKQKDKLDSDYYELKEVDGKILLTMYKEGDFWFEYANGEVKDHIYIHAWLPSLGLYSSETRPDNSDKITTLLGNTTTYKEKQESTVYLLYWDPENKCTYDETTEDDDWTILEDTIDISVKDSAGQTVPTDSVKIDKITSGYKITTTDKMTGDYTITATCELHIHDENASKEDKNQTFNFNVTCDPIAKLQVKTPPTKTTYTEGESFDKTGMAIQGVYSDNSTIDLTDYTVAPSGALKATDKQVTISYNNKKVTQAITVNSAPQTTEAPTAATTETPAAETKVGDKTVSGNGTYQVTASSDKKEVAYVSTNKAVKKVTVPSTVTIDGTAYTVTSISANAFANQKKLTAVTIPSTVVTIENGAFKNCSKLKKVTIPTKVTSIGKNAFSGCKNMKTITIKSKKITKIGKNAFKGISSKATIKVPKSKKKAYTKLLKKSGYKGKIK